MGDGFTVAEFYVLLNTVIDPEPRTTALTLPAILARSFETMLRESYRQALNVVIAFCVAQDIPLGFAAIPSTPGRTEHSAMLNFQTESMRALFEAGRTAAQRTRSGSIPRRATSRGVRFWSG